MLLSPEAPFTAFEFVPQLVHVSVPTTFGVVEPVHTFVLFAGT